MLYEDKLVVMSAPERPATKGHVCIRTAATAIDALSPEDFAHVLSAATFASSALFEHVGAQGSNILFSDVDGVVVDVVARTEGDGLTLRWDPTQILPEEMDAITAKIKDACDYIDADVPKQTLEKQPVSAPAGKEEPESTRDVKSYLLKKLDRLP